MITKLQNPLVAMGLSLVLSIALGVGLCWRAAGPLLAVAVATAAKLKPAPDKREKGWDFWTIEIENLSSDLKEERASLHKQEDLLDQRAARLAAEEKEIAKVRHDIENLRKEIGDRVIEITADEAKNIRTLSQTYTNLSPKAVVAIFKEMDDVTVVKILNLMKPDVVGPIFEEMSKTTTPAGSLARRAAMLSEKLRLVKAAKSTN